MSDMNAENAPEAGADETTTPAQGEDAPEVENEAQETEEAEKPNKAAREAAKYRTQLREAETALEAANARIEGFQRADIERAAGEVLSAPGDLLLLSGKAVADFLNEDGAVDTQAVTAEAEAVLKTRPGLRKYRPYVDPTQGLGRSNTRRGPAWSDLFEH